MYNIVYQKRGLHNKSKEIIIPLHAKDPDGEHKKIYEGSNWTPNAPFKKM